MYSRYNCFALHNNVLLYIMLLCKGEHLTESRKPTTILLLINIMNNALYLPACINYSFLVVKYWL